MRKQYLLIGAVCALLTLAACSSSKYTYNFDHYDYNSGKKSKTEKSLVRVVPPNEINPLTFNEKDLSASISPLPVVSDEVKVSSPPLLKEMADRYESMSRVERKEFRKELKKEIKNYAKELKSGDQGAHVTATKELDDELKLAIIFGAIGITLTVLGGINTVFWVLGVIGLIIGLVFFIRWISRQ